MAKGDLLKRLFLSFKNNNRDEFYKAASELIDDEARLNHSVLASDLRRIINGNYRSQEKLQGFSLDLPKDKEKAVPLVETLYSDKNLNDLIVSEKTMELLKQIIREFNNWDVLTSNGVYPTRRVLLYGPPGCGKTLTAHAIAGEIGIPLLYVRFDAIISSYLGETSGNIRKVFDFAKDSNWVILFDEFDAIGRSRSDSEEHGEIKRVVNAFLQQLDNFKGRSLIIAATNFERALDYALWRRFDETIAFQMPNHQEKVKLFTKLLKYFNGPAQAFDILLKDTERFSFSDIEKTAQSIIKTCILNGTRIYSKKDIESAIAKQKSNVELRKTTYQ